MAWKKLLGLASSVALVSVVAVVGNGCSSSNSAGGGGDGGGSDVVVHKDSGSSSGSSSGAGDSGDDGSSAGSFDGTTGKTCTKDADCKTASGPGVNKCSSDTFQSGTLYPTPICIMPTNCDPGTDGNLHFCDGPDQPSSPGVCLSTGTAGKGICLPQCNFKTDGSAATGCQGKDTCFTAAFSDNGSGGVLGIGYCFGGCAADADCQNGDKCQVNIGLCLKSTVAPQPAGQGCNSTTLTGAAANACNCFSNTQTNLGFCANFCSIGGVTCPTGWNCETDLPTTLTNSADATIAGWTKQNPGMAGVCIPTCVIDGGAQFDGGVCPTNSKCQTGTVAGPDCLP